MIDDSNKFLEAILDSNSRYKLIIAGAGTGKTYTFKQLLKNVNGKSLALTFINNLARDMSDELGELADARTFHSFCRKILHKSPTSDINNSFHFFSKLNIVIAGDAEFLNYNFDEPRKCLPRAFRTLTEDDGRIDYFLKRAAFYNAVSFDDSVYRVLKLFRSNGNIIPIYDQIVVDEYQDFNLLEVEFIKHLETRSPILIVGDDDQAIYFFRDASPSYLRNVSNDSKYSLFTLPYCRRCTDVVVKATNEFISSAIAKGNLEGRIEKEYICFVPSKEEDSINYPKIIHARCSVNNKRAPYIARYIDNTIRNISETETKKSIKNKYPLVLIVGPTHYLNSLYDYLNKVHPNVVYKSRGEEELTYLDGYNCLLEDVDSKLGWRILAEMDNPSNINNIVAEADKKNCNIHDIIDLKVTNEHKKRLGYLKSLLCEKSKLDRIYQDELSSYFDMSCDNLKNSINRTSSNHDGIDESKPIIRLTTYNGCKGLSAGFVFIVGLDQDVFPRDSQKIKDTDVCQFIVALTRTRKECHLISTNNIYGKWKKESVFISYLPISLIKKIDVDKKYFKN